MNSSASRPRGRDEEDARSENGDATSFHSALPGEEVDRFQLSEIADAIKSPVQQRVVATARQMWGLSHETAEIASSVRNWRCITGSLFMTFISYTLILGFIVVVFYLVYFVCVEYIFENDLPEVVL